MDVGKDHQVKPVYPVLAQPVGEDQGIWTAVDEGVTVISSVNQDGVALADIEDNHPGVRYRRPSNQDQNQNDHCTANGDQGSTPRKADRENPGQKDRQKRD